MKHTLMFLCALLVVSLLTACGSRPSIDNTSALLAGTYTTVITQADLDRVPGSGYTGSPGTWILKLDDAGGNFTFIASKNGVKENEGTYTAGGSQFTITDPRCGQAFPGVYTWTFTQKMLTLKVGQDQCTNRRVVLTAHPWAKTVFYTFTGRFNDPSFPTITFPATPIIPPKDLSTLPSDRVQIRITGGKLTFSTNDPQYQCIQGQVPLLFDEELAYPGVFLAVYNNCGSIVSYEAGQAGLALVASPLIPHSGGGDPYVMFTIPQNALCSTNVTGQRQCLAAKRSLHPVLSVSPSSIDLRYSSPCSYEPKPNDFWHCVLTLTNDGQSELNWEAYGTPPDTVSFIPPLNGSFIPSWNGGLGVGEKTSVNVYLLQGGYYCTGTTLLFKYHDAGPTNTISVPVTCPVQVQPG